MGGGWRPLVFLGKRGDSSHAVFRGIVCYVHMTQHASAGMLKLVFVRASRCA